MPAFTFLSRNSVSEKMQQLSYIHTTQSAIFLVDSENVDIRLVAELTYQFFKTMLKFCFPYNNTDEDDVSAGKEVSKIDKSSSSMKKSLKVSNFYVDLHKDVEIMKVKQIFIFEWLCYCSPFGITP